MSAKSLFSKKNIESQQPDTRTGIMEELNLPPELISFVRKNARTLQIVLAGIVVLILLWAFYDYYSEMQKKKGASLLAAAIQTESTDERMQKLSSVINDYSGTDAAVWGKLEMAHMDYNDGRLDAAITKYEEILNKLPADSSLAPLVRMNLSQSFEMAGDQEKAVAQYNLLKKATGFEEAAHIALARIYKEKGESARARKEYEELLSSLEEDADPKLKSRIQAMLAAIEGEKSTPASKPEEN
ncbi:MAG: tetratricopeptide repeat protein [Deltaproteobacteria bacterium]|jgi:predicted negative regulator of RcsB-dependent stress response|nr:tetratricopeptide repeat protein [Deltaproteobacteria bacterium]